MIKAGRFPVRVQIKAADGSDWSSPTTITVSSSAYGTLTIALIAVAGGALTLMVALRLGQRLRSRNDRGAGAGNFGTQEGAGEPQAKVVSANDSTSGHAASPPGAPGNPPGGDASLSRLPASPGQQPEVAPPADEQENIQE